MTDGRNSDPKVQDLTVWQNQLPTLKLSQSQLAKQLGRMQYIATVAKAAMDELSSNYTYSEWKLRTTLAVTAQLRQAIDAGDISPEEETAYQQDIEAYLAQMLEVVQVAGGQILTEQKRAAKVAGKGGLIDDLRSFFGG